MAVALGILSSLFITALSYAQTSPSLIVFWEANAYAPSNFTGKVLSPRGGTISASATLFSAGKPVSLASREVRWFLENELYQAGKNLKQITFQAPIQNADSVRLKVVVLGTPNIEQTITIPIARPVVRIKTTSLGGTIQATQVDATALPYFFSIQNPNELSFAWSANGATLEETSNSITVDASAGKTGDTIDLGVRTLNRSAVIESASDKMTLRIK